MLVKYGTFHDAVGSIITNYDELNLKYECYETYLNEYDEYTYFLTNGKQIYMVIDDLLMSWVVIPSCEIDNDKLRELVEYLQWTEYEISAFLTEDGLPYLEITKGVSIDSIIHSLNKTK